MTIGELREVLHDVVKRYFLGASVKWTNENNTKPVGPLVTLQLGNIHRELFSIVENRQGHPVKLYHSRAMLDVNLYTPGRMGKAQPGIVSKAENTALNDLQDFVSYMDSDYAMNQLDAADVTVLQEGPTLDVSSLIDSVKYEYRAMQQFSVTFTQNAAGPSGIIHIPSRSDNGELPVNPDSTPDTHDNPDNPGGAPCVPDNQEGPGNPGNPDNPDTPGELEEALPDSSVWEQTSSGGGSQELADMSTGWFEAVEIEKTKE